VSIEDFAYKLFQDRYAARDENKIIETEFSQMWERVANFVSKEVKKDYELFRDALWDFKLIPAGRILAGAGIQKKLTFANCYFLQIGDSRDEIYQALHNTANILAAGGGVGHDFSLLRPEGSEVKGVRGTSSGPIGFISVFNQSALTISQAGERRGAQLASLSINHPDIYRFIKYKSENPGDWSTYNVSVKITSEFIKALKEDGKFKLFHLKGEPKKHNKIIDARELFEEICKMAWISGDPGLLFIDKANEISPLNGVVELSGSNPCGEQILNNYGVCNLSSINLTKFVTENKTFDFDAFSYYIRIGVRFLDNIIDLNYYPIEKAKEIAQSTRRIGLGMTGIADAMIMLKLKYGSNDSLKWFEKIAKTFLFNTIEESINLSQERGAFPLFNPDIYLKTKFAREKLTDDQKDKINKFGIRNGDLTAIAPTGSISLLAGISSGIEPNFDSRYIRRDRLGEHEIIHPLYKGNEDVFVTANKLPIESHLKILEIAQKYITNSVSKTVNLASSSSIEDIKKVFLYAIDSEIKGITVFRDGCKKGVLDRGTKIIPEKKKEIIKSRPECLTGFTYQQPTPLGKALITINENSDREPFEVIITVGKSGSDIGSLGEAIGRLISFNLRTESTMVTEEKLDEIINHLQGIGGAGGIGFGKSKVKSLPDAIAKVLSKYKSKHIDVKTIDICPQCGVASLVSEEGCVNCKNCGYSKC